MKSMGISQFKTHCISVLKQAQRTGEPLLITHRGRSIARVEPIRDQAQARSLGLLRDMMTIRGDIVHADFPDDWEMDRDRR